MLNPKELTAIVLASAIMTTALPSVPAFAQSFSDVPFNHWAYKVIDEVSDDGIMAGLGNNIFAPDKTLSRAEFAALLYKMDPNKSSSNDSEHVDGILLNDVDSGVWYYEAVSWAAEHGYLSVNDGDIEPEATVTREDMAVGIYEFLHHFRANNLVYDENRSPFADESEFKDVTSIGKVHILANNGILGGKGDNIFDPQGSLTRAEMASIISRAKPILNNEDQNHLAKDISKKNKETLEAGTLDLTSEESQHIDLINKERKKAGVSALKASPLLMEAAEIRAKEVVEKASNMTREEFYDRETYPGTWWHARPDGLMGPAVIMDLMDDNTMIAWYHMSPSENLVPCYGATVLSPQKAVNSILSSESHTRAMLSLKNNYVGVAYYNNGKCSVWVQLFAGV